MTVEEPYIIRLRGPWNLSVEGEGSVKAHTGQSWSKFIGTHQGPVMYTRHFNQPSGLDSKAVFLCITEFLGSGTVHLNGRQLGELYPHHIPWRSDITKQMAARNLVAIELKHSTADGGITGEVRLEICSS